MVRPFGRREPPRGACGAARHLRSSSVLAEGADSSRCRFPSPSGTAFNRESFDPSAYGAARIPLLRGASVGRRPSAPIGWESLTVRASFWRPLSRDGLGIAGSDPRLRAWSPCCAGSLAGRRSRAPPPRQIRRCRRRFRTTATGKTSAPSIGSSRTSRPGWAPPRSLFTRAVSPRTLLLAASLGLPRQGPPGRLELSRAPANRLAAPRVVRRERCVSPTSATDSVHEHPADCCVSGCVRRGAPPCGRSSRSSHRLTLGRSRAARDPGSTSLSAFPVSHPDGALA